MTPRVPRSAALESRVIVPARGLHSDGSGAPGLTTSAWPRADRAIAMTRSADASLIGKSRYSSRGRLRVYTLHTNDGRVVLRRPIKGDYRHVVRQDAERPGAGGPLLSNPTHGAGAVEAAR